MTKILITGSNGLVAQKIYGEARKDPDLSLILTSRSGPLFDHGDHVFEQFDVSDFDRAEKLISNYRPGVVIHTAALSQADYCEQNPGESARINFRSVQNLVYLSQLYPFHLIFLSSDFVFPGDRGHYCETDIPVPLSVYGHHKFNAEKCILHNSPFHAVVRTSLVYGWLPRMSRPNLFIHARNSLKNASPLNIVSDQFRSPTLAEDLARGIIEIVRQKKTGIYHLAGKDFISVYDFVIHIARHYGYDESLVKPVLTHELNEPAKRPQVTGLTIEKAKKDFGYMPVSLDEGIRYAASQA